MSYRFNKDSRSSKRTPFKKGNKRSNLANNPLNKKDNDFKSGSRQNVRNQYSVDGDSHKDRANYQKNSRNQIPNSRNIDENLSDRDRSQKFKNINSNFSNNQKTNFPRRKNSNIYKDYKDKRDPRTLSIMDEQSLNPKYETFSNSPPDDLLWGRHSTEAALLSSRPIHRIWCTSELRSSPKFFQLLRDSKSTGVLVEEVSWSRLGQITKGAVHQGIVLQIAASKTLELKDLIQGCKSLGDSSLLLALDGLTDPHNLGAIIRSAEALGAHGLVIPQRRSAGLTGSVAKVAAGALEHLPVARVVNLNRSLEKLKQFGFTVIGLAEEGDSTLPEIDIDGPIVVVTGSEDKGISLLTRKICDQLVRIPLRGVTPSLNASVATSVCLYEVARKRWMRTLSGQAPSPRTVKPLISTDIPSLE